MRGTPELTAQLTSRLMLDLDVAHINYDIGTVNGVVHMMGIAQDEEELSRVVDRARDPRDGPWVDRVHEIWWTTRAIPGVRRVANHVGIKDAGSFRPPAHPILVLRTVAALRSMSADGNGVQEMPDARGGRFGPRRRAGLSAWIELRSSFVRGRI